jgi:signal transduction histidine kinase/ActR/RegA family two-component response regulator
MRIRSIKAAFRFFIALIVLLTAMAIFDNVMERMMAREMEKLHAFLDYEKTFAELILEERAALGNGSAHPQVVELYASLGSGLQDRGYDNSLLNSRRTIYDHLYESSRKSEQHIRRVRQLFPDLINSVKYVHEHHITYLKNLMRRGRLTQDYDPDSDVDADFSRSAVHAAPELDIVRMAVAIQSRLLDLLAIFNKVHFGDNPSTLKAAFQHKIKDFYDAVNTFEDYSLDTQDGLLVEELLINGRPFEDHFNQLLAGEIQIRKYSSQLKDNDTAMLAFLKKTRNGIRGKLARQNEILRVMKYTGSAAFVVLIAVLAYLGRRIRREFQRNVSETQRIQGDIDYRISIHPDNFSEFKVVYHAMNAMADTIKQQVDDLEAARTQLRLKVKARTANLERANQLLKREIEEREKAEQQRIELENRLSQAKKMEAIGTLAGGVAHDLNNILSGVVSYPDLILNAMPSDHDLRKPMEIIKSSGEKAAAIVQDLLTLARRGVNTSEVIDLRPIVESYLDSPEFRKLELRFPRVRFIHRFISEPAIIKGSPVHLEKTVMNLVSNAFESIAQRGTVTVAIENVYVDTPIEGYETVEEGEYIQLTVADDGMGISAADLERIFEPFFTKKKMGCSGTGLGMAVVWGTVKDHNGYIDVHSQEGEGTAFTLYFPMSRELPARETADASPECIRGEGQCILIVDDMADQRKIAVDILTSLGYRSVSVAGGDEAVRYMNENAVDLMILDMIMPHGMDGLDTYRAVLSIRPQARAIIASGFSETERVRKAQELGACLYIRKPYSVRKIAAAVHQALAAPPVCMDQMTYPIDLQKTL